MLARGVLAGRCAIRLFSISRIVVEGELVHNNAVTLRANVAPHLAGNFFTIDLPQAQRVLRAGALGAQSRSAPRVPQ